MNYLTKFDSNGKRVTSYPLDDTITDERYAELIGEGFIEIEEEEWNYYVGNKGDGDNGTGYIRDSATGKPVSAPAYVPSKEERLAALDAAYDSDRADLMKYFSEALLANDEETQAEIREELQEIDDEYVAARKATEEE